MSLPQSRLLSDGRFVVQQITEKLRVGDAAVGRLNENVTARVCLSITKVGDTSPDIFLCLTRSGVEKVSLLNRLSRRRERLRNKGGYCSSDVLVFGVDISVQYAGQPVVLNI